MGNNKLRTFLTGFYCFGYYRAGGDGAGKGGSIVGWSLQCVGANQVRLSHLFTNEQLYVVGIKRGA